MLFKNKLIEKLENSGIKIAIVIDKELYYSNFSVEYNDALQSCQFEYNDDRISIINFEKQYIVVDEVDKAIEIGSGTYKKIEDNEKYKVLFKTIDFKKLDNADIKYFDKLYKNYENHFFAIKQEIIKELNSENVIMARFNYEKPYHNILPSEIDAGKDKNSVFAIYDNGLVTPLHSTGDIVKGKKYNINTNNIEVKPIIYDNVKTDILYSIYSALKNYQISQEEKGNQYKLNK